MPPQLWSPAFAFAGVERGAAHQLKFSDDCCLVIFKSSGHHRQAVAAIWRRSKNMLQKITAFWIALLMVLPSMAVAQPRDTTLDVPPHQAQQLRLAGTPQIRTALSEVSASPLRADVEKLSAFSTRSTISSADPSLNRGLRPCGSPIFRKNYFHQLQNRHTVNGIEYGDLPKFVDYDYLANVTRLNVATLAGLASAPAPPSKVRLETNELVNDSTLFWQPSPAGLAASYQVLWRLTTSTERERVEDAGNVTRPTFGLSKDYVVFACVR
jgi:hypothetical protein